MNIKLTAPSRIACEIDLPASKSMSNRVLIIDALCGGRCRVHSLAQCDDTAAVQRALASPDARVVDVGAAGTAMRFLTAYLATCEGRDVTIDGSERMRHRPIGVLVDALRQLGASIDYAGQQGCAPLRIEGRKLHGGRVRMAGNVSSQYVTALLLIAPAIGGIELTVEGDIASRPYIDMTLGLMKQFGIASRVEGNVITVPAGSYQPRDYSIEADWSAASYWYGLQAVLPGSRISLKGLEANSCQGDSRIARLMWDLGVTSNWCGSYLDLGTAAVVPDGPVTVDLADVPDLAQTLAVTLCLLGRPYRLAGLATLRIKETDRLAALQAELGKLGYVVHAEGDEALCWDGSTTLPAAPVPHIATYCDHRMAMAMAIAAVKFPGLVIDDAQVVSKSYPQFWQHLRQAGFKIEQIDR